ncbi:MAG: FAD-binding oxidoreductase [Nitrososphaeraceae archaeon]
MPDPKFVKPWHGIPRENINWHPIVDEDACIGCGTCVTGCGRVVYRYDFERKKAVVADPLNCMVGCTTCANTCPTKAISFPPLSEVASILQNPEVHHAIENELLSRKEQFQWADLLPHRDRIVNMVVDGIVQAGKETLLVSMTPKTKQVDCFCEFMPGQYVEVWIPDSQWMSRAYSIGNSPHEDGGIELQIRKVEGGRFSAWAFEKMKLGDVVSVRGPLGSFTFSSEIDRPVLFVAGGTGFAPIKSMIEQILKVFPQRKDLVLYWGAHDSNGFYELDVIASWLKTNPDLKCVLATRNVLESFIVPKRCDIINKTLSDAIADFPSDFAGYDAYVAGPVQLLPAVIKVLTKKGLKQELIKIDSFGG